jgi:hypothetical protein
MTECAWTGKHLTPDDQAYVLTPTTGGQEVVSLAALQDSMTAGALAAKLSDELALALDRIKALEDWASDVVKQLEAERAGQAPAAKTTTAKAKGAGGGQ